jgi:Holliday junction DNA helicase RuvB
VEEILYPAMEDYQLDLIIGEGPAARSVRIDLPPFTLVGATTRSGLLTTPLRERFGIPLRLDFYGAEDLAKIVTRGAKLLGAPLEAKAAAEIARRSRGTPRVAGRLLRRVRDFAAMDGGGSISLAAAQSGLARLDIDDRGLDTMDRRYLRCIAETYGGGPVGVETIAAVLAEQRDMVEDVIEPYLIQSGLVQRTPRGRMITQQTWAYLGLEAPTDAAPRQLDLLGPAQEGADDGE